MRQKSDEEGRGEGRQRERGERRGGDTQRDTCIKVYNKVEDSYNCMLIDNIILYTNYLILDTNISSSSDERLCSGNISSLYCKEECSPASALLR